MGIRESLLNTITSVADSDFVRIVTAAGASSKATVANLFKSFESGLSSKSSLTTSDYIRVVGSDNEAYKQSVSNLFDNILKTYTSGSIAGNTQTIKSALDASIAIPNLANGRLAYHNDTDFDTITEEWCLAKGVNSPNSTYFYYLHTIAYMANSDGTVNVGKQIAYSYSTTDEEVYVRRRTGGAWTAWQKSPTRAEMTKTTSTITAEGGWTLGDIRTCAKIGSTVVFDYWCSYSGTPTIKQWITIGTIPSGYRPAYAYDMVAVDNSGVTSGVQTKVEASGAIKVYLMDNRSKGLRIHGVHFV